MRGEGAASAMVAFTLTPGFIFAVALMTVASVAYLLRIGRKVVEEEEEEGKHVDDLADRPTVRIDRGKELASTVRMVMRVKRKMRRYKERRSVQNKTD